MPVIVKRNKNFAAREPGVILVFCILGALAILVTTLMVYRRISKRRAAKA